MKKPKHILVIRLSAMGDVAMIVPVLRVFSQTYPEVKLTVLSRVFFKPFFEDLPNVNFLEAEVEGKHKGFLGLLKLAKEAKTLDVDAVADLHNVIRSKIITSYLCISGKKTTTVNKGRAEKKALTRETNKVFKQLKSTHQRYADVFRNLGYPLDLSTFQPLPRKDFNQKLQNLVGSTHKKIIGIAPFAAYKSKMYPLELMREVISELDKTQEYHIVLFGGGKTEIEQLNILENDFSSVKNAAGKLNFKEELALISNLDGMLSMDSGNGHLAAMFGVPVITLWGVTHPFAGFLPFGQVLENCLTADREKFPLLPTSIYGNKFPEGYEDSMKTISPQKIIENLIFTLQNKS
ncbi:MAG: glycosyltransferase family 9 protein [Flavobacteriaceae bacterium]|nr:glycosyltransferase family 9 protein [Flavobacteriaceae bacterium]